MSEFCYRKLKFWSNDFGSRVTMHFGYPNEFYSTIVLRQPGKKYNVRELCQFGRATRDLFRNGYGSELKGIADQFNRNLEEKK